MSGDQIPRPREDYVHQIPPPSQDRKRSQMPGVCRGRMLMTEYEHDTQMSMATLSWTFGDPYFLLMSFSIDFLS